MTYDITYHLCRCQTGVLARFAFAPEYGASVPIQPCYSSLSFAAQHLCDHVIAEDATTASGKVSFSHLLIAVVLQAVATLSYQRVDTMQTAK